MRPLNEYNVSFRLMLSYSQRGYVVMGCHFECSSLILDHNGIESKQSLYPCTMPQEFSDSAIREYLHVMRAIYAAVEVEIISVPSLEKKDRLFVDYFEKEFGYRKIRFTMMIFNTWLKGTDFIGEALSFKKINPQAKWSDMCATLGKSMKVYEGRLFSKEKKITDSAVKLPSGTGWEDLELRFKDGHTLTVFVKGSLYAVSDSTQLGFGMGNTKSKKVGKPWKFLGLLAICEQNRRIRPPLKSLFLEALQTTPEGSNQIRSQLSKKLQSAFGIWEDPFYPYDPDNGYRLKFRLMPEPSFRGSGELHSSAGKLHEEMAGDVLEGMND